MFGVMYELNLNVQKHRFYLTVDRYLFADFEFSLYRYQYIQNQRPPVGSLRNTKSQNINMKKNYL
ncbi:hypothetical protein EAG08_17005 [Chryseobacterium sp. 3008163]|nr:hypothetical protein EAG08_17005 [Chryseobacterium sp. 3008163]